MWERKGDRLVALQFEAAQGEYYFAAKVQAFNVQSGEKS
jgi:hypothetical protein